MTIDTGLIRWRVVRNMGNGIAQLVGYIDGRTCMELLDEKGEWSVEHTPILSEGKLIGVQAAITIDGVTRSDVGVPSNQDPVKGAYSDALKRAAVHFGIGRELYDLPQVYAGFDPETKSPTQKPRFNAETSRWEIDAPGWVWYPEEEANPGESLKDQLDAIKAILKAAPALAPKSKEYVEEHKLNKNSAADMKKLADYLTEEASREDN